MSPLSRATSYALVLLALGAIACSDDSETDRPSADAAATEAGADAISDVASAPPDAAACSAITGRAVQQLQPALVAARADLSCQTDDDCVFAGTDSDCTVTCGNLLNQTGLAAAKAAIAAVNRDICPAFVAAGCTLLYPPCTPPLSAACVAGMCTDFPPARWATFSIDKNPGQAIATPPACSTAACTLWKVTPDGAVAKTSAGVATTAMLSAADLATVDGILRSAAFRKGENEGFTCTAVRPPGGGVAFAIERDNSTVGFDVSACVTAGDNQPAQLYRVISAY